MSLLVTLRKALEEVFVHAHLQELMDERVAPTLLHDIAILKALQDDATLRVKSQISDNVRKGGEGDTESLVTSLVRDAEQWGKVAAWKALHGPNVLLRRNLCEPDCEVCRSLYTDAQGRLLSFPLKDLMRNPLNNLDADFHRTLDKGGNVLNERDWGYRTIGVAHKWDTPDWSVVEEQGT